MITHRFNIKDIKVESKYKYIIKQLEGIIFYIEITEDELEKHLVEGRSLDTLWDIGYDTGYTKYNNMKYWIDIIDDIVETKEMSDKEYDMYIDFKGIFEDLCVEQCIKFEGRLTN